MAGRVILRIIPQVDRIAMGKVQGQVSHAIGQMFRGSAGREAAAKAGAAHGAAYSTAYRSALRKGAMPDQAAERAREAQKEAAAVAAAKRYAKIIGTAVTAVLVAAADAFEKRVNDVIANVEGLEKEARHQRLKPLTESDRAVYGEILKGMVSERSAAEGFSSTRPYYNLDDAGRVEAGLAFARIEEVGGSSDDLSAIIKRWIGKGATASQISGVANVFAALSAKEDRPVGETISSVQQHGTTFENMGLTPIHGAASVASMQGQGFSPGGIMGLLARIPKMADANNVSSMAYMLAMQEAIREADSDAEGAAAASKFAPGGLSEVPRSQTASYVRKGNDLITGVPLDILRDPGLSVVSATREEQLDAATAASVMTGESVPGGTLGGVYGDVLDAFNPGTYVGMATDLFDPSTWWGSREGSAREESARAAAGQQALRDNMFVGGNFEKHLRDQFSIPEGTPLREHHGAVTAIQQGYVADPMIAEHGFSGLTAGATGIRGGPSRSEITNIKTSILGGEGRSTNEAVAILADLSDATGGISEEALRGVEAGTDLTAVVKALEEGTARFNDTTEVEETRLIAIAKKMNEAGVGFEQASAKLRLLGTEFSSLQGLAPEDQLREIAARIQAIDVPDLEDVGKFLNLISDFVNQPEVQRTIADDVADSLFNLGKSLDEVTTGDRLAVLSGQLGEWAAQVTTGGVIEGEYSPGDVAAFGDVQHQEALASIVSILRQDPASTTLAALLPGYSEEGAAAGEERPEWSEEHKERVTSIKDLWAGIRESVSGIGLEVQEVTTPSLSMVGEVIGTSKENMGLLLADLGTIGGTSLEAEEQAKPLWNALAKAHEDAKAVVAHMDALNGKTFNVTVRVAYEADEVYGVPDAGPILQSQDNLRRQESAATEDTRRSVEPDYSSGAFGI